MWIQQQSGLELLDLVEFGSSSWRPGRLPDQVSTCRFLPPSGPPLEGNGGVPRSLILDRSGQVWSASTRGILLVAREQNMERQKAIPLIASVEGTSGTLWDGSLGSHSRVIAVSAADADFVEIRIAYPHYHPEVSVRLEYRLEDADPAWIHIGKDRSFHLRRLGPGHHRLRLAAVGPDGRRESATPLSVGFRWHQRPLVRTSGIVMALGLLGGIGLLLVQRTRRLAESVQRTRLDAERWRIARDLHDSIGAGLARISIATYRTEPELSWAARDLIRELEQVVWVINPKRDNLVSTIEFLAQEVQLQLSRSPIRVQMELGEVPEAVMVTGPARRSLLLVLRGTLSNVLKHSHADCVSFSARIEDRQFRMSVSDNGRGFDAGRSRVGSVGIEILQSRVQALGGLLKVQSATDSGTSVVVTVPLRNLSSANPEGGQG